MTRFATVSCRREQVTALTYGRVIGQQAIILRGYGAAGSGYSAHPCKALPNYPAAESLNRGQSTGTTRSSPAIPRQSEGLSQWRQSLDVRTSAILPGRMIQKHAVTGLGYIKPSLTWESGLHMPSTKSIYCLPTSSKFEPAYEFALPATGNLVR